MARKNKVDVSIVIVNYKSWNHLRNCLNSIKNLNNLSFTFETIVIDNHSNDGHFKSFATEFLQVSFFLNSLSAFIFEIKVCIMRTSIREIELTYDVIITNENCPKTSDILVLPIRLI